MLLILAILIPSMPIRAKSGVVSNVLQQEVVYIGDGYEIEFQVVNKWSNQYEGAFIIKNIGIKTIENWKLTCQYDNEIKNIWNAKVDSKNNGYYTIKNVGWNQDILPQQSVKIGFIASFKSEISPPTNLQIPMDEEIVDREKYKIEFIVTSDWGNGFNGVVKVSNIGNVTIEDWKLEFDIDRKIENFWTGDMILREDNHYVIQNMGYNSNIEPGKTISLGFSGGPGKNNPTLDNPVLIEQGKVVDLTKDSDNDGLLDVDEDIIGTNKFKADTDNDGLLDGYEVYDLDTDPLLFDTDNNGTPDGEEDFDEDGLTNKEEYNLGTIPFSEDTDNDGIVDGDEIYKTFTNPLLEDTDGDGILDGDELILNLNPLTQYTTEGIFDGEVIFEQTISKEKLSNINEDNNYELSIDVIAGGYADSAIEIKESNGVDSLSDNASILGKVISFEYIGYELKDATLNFKISQNEINQGGPNTLEESGMEGLQRFQIFRYNEELGMLYPVNTVYNLASDILTVEHCAEGSYCVIDLSAWLYSLGIDLSNDLVEDVEETKSISAGIIAQNEVIEKIEVEEEKSTIIATESAIYIEETSGIEDELPDNYDEIMLSQIVQSELTDRSTILDRFNMSSNIKVNKQIDLTFIIDTSGSMSSRINACKSYMKSLVKNLYDDNITAHVSVLSFDDYVNDIVTYKLPSGHIWGKNPTEADSLISQVNITNGWRENHIDALVAAKNLTYRGNTTKFAVILTDEPLTRSDNKSEDTTLTIAEKLKENNIITSVVCSNSHVSTFRPIFEQTDGIQISISSNFNYYLELFIKTVMKDNKRYTAVIPNNLTSITLNSVPERNSNVDTDNDGLTDSKEIDWSLIKDDNGILLLPTLKEYLVANAIKDFETFSRLSKEKANIINSIVVLPIYSNPMKADSDGDGYLDNVDVRPLISDVIVTKLKNNKFLPIVDEGDVYYGGDQEWFKNEIGINGGCGTVAAANTATYLAKYNKELAKLYQYSTSSISKVDFIKHMDEMFKYVTPKKIGDQPLGVWPLSHYTRGFVNFAKSNDTVVKPYLVNNTMNKKNATDYVKKGLRQNNPISMLIGWNPKLSNVTTYDPTDNSSSLQNYNMHWVTITEIKEDLIANKTTMKVSSWGCYAYIDMEDYIIGENIYKSIVFFVK